MERQISTYEFEKGGRRDKGLIVLDILQVLRNGNLRFTPLLYKSNLSCDRLKHYLAELVEKRLVEINETRKGILYSLTDEGRTVYAQYSSYGDFVRQLHV